jgi:hypothetical protein
MNRRTRIPRRSRRTMTPSLDPLETRQLLSAAPVHSHAEALRHHRAAMVERAREAHHAAAKVSAAAATPDAATSGFSVAPSPAAPNGVLTAATEIADNDIWAVGYEDVQTAPPAFNTTLAEHFNGTSWSVVPTPAVPSGGVNSPSAEFLGVAAAASNDVWAVGIKTGPDNPDFGEQLIENWNGTAWSVVTGPEMEGAELTSVAAISANNVWAFGGGGGSDPLVEHFNGTTWSIVPNTGALATATGISAVSVDSANDIWAVGGNGKAEVLFEFNGTTWSQVAVVPDINGYQMGVNSITAISPTDVWIAGSGFFEDIRRGNKTEDFSHQAVAQWNGTSLNVVTTPTPDPGELVSTSFTGIAAVSANDIVAVGTISGSTSNEAATLIEKWNGTSWSIVSSPSPGTGENFLHAVTALSDGTVVTVGTQENTGTGVNTPLILQN